MAFRSAYENGKLEAARQASNYTDLGEMCIELRRSNPYKGQKQREQYNKGVDDRAQTTFEMRNRQMNEGMNATVASTVAPVEHPEPILIRGPRELRWNRVTGQYELVEVTPEMVEQTRRRSAYVQEFNPCGVA